MEIRSKNNMENISIAPSIIWQMVWWYVTFNIRFSPYSFGTQIWLVFKWAWAWLRTCVLSIWLGSRWNQYVEWALLGKITLF